MPDELSMGALILIVVSAVVAVIIIVAVVAILVYKNRNNRQSRNVDANRFIVSNLRSGENVTPVRVTHRKSQYIRKSKHAYLGSRKQCRPINPYGDDIVPGMWRTRQSREFGVEYVPLMTPNESRIHGHRTYYSHNPATHRSDRSSMASGLSVDIGNLSGINEFLQRANRGVVYVPSEHQTPITPHKDEPRRTSSMRSSQGVDMGGHYHKALRMVDTGNMKTFYL